MHYAKKIIAQSLQNVKAIVKANANKKQFFFIFCKMQKAEQKNQKKKSNVKSLQNAKNRAKKLNQNLCTIKSNMRKQMEINKGKNKIFTKCKVKMQKHEQK